MKTLAIIQARMGSERLPGKIFMDLAGKSLIWHIVERLKRVKNLDGIAIATSNKVADNKIEEFASAQNLSCFRGSEEDVLERFIGAAEKFGAENIIRITADAALIDPEQIEKMIEKGTRESLDYVFYDPNLDHVYEGFEFISLATLKRIRDFTNEKPYREHVTKYIRENPSCGKVGYLQVKNQFLKSNFPQNRKLSVDTLDDLNFMNKIYLKLYKPDSIVDLEAALDLIKQNAI